MNDKKPEVVKLTTVEEVKKLVNEVLYKEYYAELETSSIYFPHIALPVNLTTYDMTEDKFDIMDDLSVFSEEDRPMYLQILSDIFADVFDFDTMGFSAIYTINGRSSTNIPLDKEFKYDDIQWMNVWKGEEGVTHYTVNIPAVKGE